MSRLPSQPGATLTRPNWYGGHVTESISPIDARNIVTALCEAYPAQTRPVDVQLLILKFSRVEELLYLRGDWPDMPPRRRGRPVWRRRYALPHREQVTA
jgi:hypothetical protein